MKPISSLTYLMMAYPGIQIGHGDKCVDWAIEMAELGYDSPHLFMLAGITKPTNYSECAAYLKTALMELGIPEKAVKMHQFVVAFTMSMRLQKSEK